MKFVKFIEIHINMKLKHKQILIRRTACQDKIPQKFENINKI